MGYKHSEETKKKIAEHSAKIWLGKKLSEQHKRKLSEAHIGKGNPSSLIHKSGKEAAHYGKRNTDEIRKKMSMAHQGITNEAEWKGFKRSQNYLQRRIFQQKIQKKVFERDNYTCRLCNKRGGILHVDHIQEFAEYMEGRFDINNCRTLCRECHYFVTFHKKIPLDSKWGMSFLKGAD